MAAFCLRIINRLEEAEMKVTECNLLDFEFRNFLRKKLQQLEVDPPNIIFPNSHKQGLYYRDRRLISVGTYSRVHHLKQTVLHELAHHINNVKNSGREKSHGEEFFKILSDLVASSNVCYNWEGEYKCIKKFYEKSQEKEIVTGGIKIPETREEYKRRRRKERKIARKLKII